VITNQLRRSSPEILPSGQIQRNRASSRKDKTRSDLVFHVVEVLRRYSNRGNLTKSVQDVLRRIRERDQMDEPGVKSTGGSGVARKRLSAADRKQLVERSRRGELIRVLAEHFGVTESCVKMILHRERRRSG